MIAVASHKITYKESIRSCSPPLGFCTVINFGIALIANVPSLTSEGCPSSASEILTRHESDGVVGTSQTYCPASFTELTIVVQFWPLSMVYSSLTVLKLPDEFH